MAHIEYRIVQHDGGWAYRVGDTISESYPSRALALTAANAAAAEQRAPGETTSIQYETADGSWREEASRGGDRPDTDVKG